MLQGARFHREPLFHFVLLAGMLFVAEALWSDDEREVIIVDTATQDFLIQQQSDLLLRPLTDAERREVIESFVEDEVLVREAKKRGFTDSSRIRALLIQNMRFFLAGDIEQPTEAELRAFFDANRERFARPPMLSLDHVFFRDANAAPPDLLAQLEAGADPNLFNDPSVPTGARLRGLDRRELVRTFGPESARAILAIGDDRWHGPLTSPAGVHFVRVAERHPKQEASFEQVRDWLEGEWALTQQRKRLDSALDEMRDDYEVIVDRPTTQ